MGYLDNDRAQPRNHIPYGVFVNLGSHSYVEGSSRRPSLGQVLRWVERDSDLDLCWNWIQLPPERRLSRYGQAVWSWKYHPSLPRKLFYVARLLRWDILGPFPPRSTFQSSCGYQACVNPHHWRWIPRPVLYRLSVNEFGWWYPVFLRNGERPARDVVLRVQHQGVVHVMATTRDAVPQLHTLCGLLVDPNTLSVLPSNAVVTCKAGC